MTIQEFRNRILLKVLLDKTTIRGIAQSTFDYDQLAKATMYATNEILKETYTDVWAKQRGKRIFIFYAPLKRIVCEIGLVTDKKLDKVQKPNILLVNLKGIIPDYRTLQGIIDDTKKLGVRNGKRSH